MQDTQFTQGSQSERGGRFAALIVVALLLIMLVVTSSAGATTMKEPGVALEAMPGLQAQASRDFSAHLNATGGAAPYSYQLAGGSLPENVTLSASGELSGQPWTAGTYWFRVAARDSAGHVGYRKYALKVSLFVPPFVLPYAWVGDSNAFASFEAWGSSGESSWKIAARDVPPGMTVSEDGREALVHGAPTEPGVYTIPVTVRDLITKAKGSASETLRVWGSNFPMNLQWVEEYGVEKWGGPLFTPEEEKNGVISGTSKVVENGRFTYDVSTALLRVFPPEGSSPEYVASCLPLSAGRCSGYGPHGEVWFTEH